MLRGMLQNKLRRCSHSHQSPTIKSIIIPSNLASKHCLDLQTAAVAEAIAPVPQIQMGLRSRRASNTHKHSLSSLNNPELAVAEEVAKEEEVMEGVVGVVSRAPQEGEMGSQGMFAARHRSRSYH